MDVLEVWSLLLLLMLPELLENGNQPSCDLVPAFDRPVHVLWLFQFVPDAKPEHLGVPLSLEQSG